MLVRILQFILGAALGGGGGYLAWLNRGDLRAIFPPGPDGPPWILVASLLALAAGIVFLVSAVHPRPNRRKAREARAQAQEAHLGEAEAYYSEAGRAADRDWRSGDIPPPAAAQTPAPAAPAPPPKPAAPEPAPVAVAPAPAPPPVPPPVMAPVAAPPKPVATATPPQPALPPVAPASFPSAATLSPIPVAAEPPPAPAAPAAAPVATSDPHAQIRAAINAGKLDEAERMLDAGRETAQGLVLADLTGLAGDHAAASGRQSHAKWLWRLAIKRFGEAGALDTPGARAVAESLRTGG